MKGWPERRRWRRARLAALLACLHLLMVALILHMRPLVSHSCSRKSPPAAIASQPGNWETSKHQALQWLKVSGYASVHTYFPRRQRTRPKSTFHTSEFVAAGIARRRRGGDQGRVCTRKGEGQVHAERMPYGDQIGGLRGFTVAYRGGMQHTVVLLPHTVVLLLYTVIDQAHAQGPSRCVGLVGCVGQRRGGRDAGQVAWALGLRPAGCGKRQILVLNLELPANTCTRKLFGQRIAQVLCRVACARRERRAGCHADLQVKLGPNCPVRHTARVGRIGHFCGRLRKGPRWRSCPVHGKRGGDALGGQPRTRH